MLILMSWGEKLYLYLFREQKKCQIRPLESSLTFQMLRLQLARADSGDGQVYTKRREMKFHLMVRFYMIPLPLEG